MVGDWDSHGVYPGGNPARIERCLWCGTTDMHDWNSIWGRRYCSTNCLRAGEARLRLAAAVCCQLVIVVPLAQLYMESLSFSPWVNSGFVLFFPIFEAPAFGLFVVSLMGISQQSKIPQDSRRDSPSLNPEMVTSFASENNCPNCGAVLDPRRIGNDMTFKCDSCGASGTLKLRESQHNRQDYR